MIATARPRVALLYYGPRLLCHSFHFRRLRLHSGSGRTADHEAAGSPARSDGARYPYRVLGVYVLGILAWGQLSTLAEESRCSPRGSTNSSIRRAIAWIRLKRNSVDTLIPKSLRAQEEQIQQKPQEALKARRRRAGPPSTPPQSSARAGGTDQNGSKARVDGTLRAISRAISTRC